MTTRLIIKGSPADAMREAEKRGITLVRTRANPSHPETVADCDEPNSGHAIRMWFAGAGEHAPYPVGTLLFFQENVNPLSLSIADRV